MLAHFVNKVFSPFSANNFYKVTEKETDFDLMNIMKSYEKTSSSVGP